MKTNFRLKLIPLLLMSIIAPFFSLAQPGPPPTNSSPMQLNMWTFADTNWFSTAGYAPVSFSNLVNVEEGGDGNALLLDTTNTSPAFLFYNVIETNGFTKISCSQGSLTLWLNPDWSTPDQGGSGPGDWANLISLGQAGTNGTPWWSWYLSPDGSTVYFSSQTNGGPSSNYLTAPVSFQAGTWYNLTLTYGLTNCLFYTNGVLVTNGTGVAYWPGTDVTFFAVGSDSNGLYQIGGMMDDLTSYNYQLDASTVAGSFAMYSLFYFGGAFQPQITSAPSTNTTVPIFNAVTGTGFLRPISTNTLSCTDSTNIWITNVVVTTQSNSTMIVTFAIAGGTNGVFYDVFANSALGFGTNFTWAWMGQGNQCVTYTITNLPNTSCFLILGKPQDTDQDGLTDAYENLVSHTDPTNPDSGGTGMLDGWKVVWGLNPLVNPVTQSNLLSNFTYDPVGELKTISGIRTETIGLDAEGNVQGDSQ